MQPRLTGLIRTPAQWFPFISPVAHRGGSLLVRVKVAEAHILTHHRACGLCPPEKSTGSRAVYKSHLQIGLCEGTRGAGIWEVSPHPSEPSSFHTHIKS